MTLKIINVAILCLAVACVRAADGLDVARSALADKLYSVAERQASQLLMTAGTPVERSGALLVYVQALAEQGRHEDVLKALNTHTATVSAGPAPLFSYWRALALLATDDPLGASKTADEGLAAQPEADDANALRRLAAQARLGLNDGDGAIALYATLDTAVTNAALRDAVLLEWARALDTLGRPAEAAAVLARQPRASPVSPHADQGALLQARLLTHLERRDEAEQVLHALADNNQSGESGRVQALVQLALLQSEGGRTNDAVTSARAATQTAQSPELRLIAGVRLGEILLSALSTLDEGETIMKALIREFPESPEARAAQMRLAYALFEAKRYEQAADAYQIYIESFGQEGRGLDALAGRARALFQIGRYSEAANLYQKLHDTTTNTIRKAESLFRAADAIAADGRFKQASQFYRSVNQLYPESPLASRALFHAADALERANDPSAAEGAFRQTTERYAGTSLAEQALLRLATLLSARNAVEAAVKTYGVALATTTNPAVRYEAQLGRGHANYRAYRFETALQDFTEAAAAAKGDGDGEAHYWQVMSLYSLGRDEESYRAGETFLTKFPQAPRLPDLLLWLAKYDYNRGRLQSACERFLLYAERWPDGMWSDAALLWAGRASFRLNDFTGAIEILGRLWKTHTESKRLAEGRFVQADALCELARFDEAVLLLGEVITRYPESDWVTPAWGRKGDALFSMGVDNPLRFEEAINAYREMLARRDITPAAALQGEFKIARCLEKLKRNTEAIEHYYTRVILKFLEQRTAGLPDADAAVWFTRAAFNAADLLAQTGDTTAAIRILRRVSDIDVPGQAEARQRLERLEQTRR